MNIEEIYLKEKLINSYFSKKYDYNDVDIFNKQVLELICELSEFAYETKCFKYWKDEKQSSPDITIPEFADCLMITLCFCDLADIDNLVIEKIDETDIVKLFIDTNRLASSLTINIDKDVILKILSNLLAISKLLDYTEEELNKYCLVKMEKTLKMIREQGYYFVLLERTSNY